MTHGSLDLLVAGVANQNNVMVAPGEALRLSMNLGDKRAGRVNRQKVALGRLGFNSGRDSVGAENKVGAFRDLTHFINKNCATLCQALHDLDIVHNLFANIDRFTVLFESLFYCNHRAIHTGTVAAG
jgi:hypothetical protein